MGMPLGPILESSCAYLKVLLSCLNILVDFEYVSLVVPFALGLANYVASTAEVVLRWDL